MEKHRSLTPDNRKIATAQGLSLDELAEPAVKTPASTHATSAGGRKCTLLHPPTAKTSQITVAGADATAVQLQILGSNRGSKAAAASTCACCEHEALRRP